MMKNIAPFLFTSIIILFIASCDDFIEDRLDDKTVKIISPVNESVLMANGIVFAWEALAEATEYKIQIATPSFDNASTLIVDTVILASDTIIRKTSFPYTLNKGIYQCRIKAVSSGSSTEFFYTAFKVLGDISENKIEIISPKEGGLIESDSIVFAWDHLNGATEYEIQVVKPSFDNISVLVVDKVIQIRDDVQKTLFLQSVLANGNYEWRVRAKISGFYTPYTFVKFNVQRSIE